MIADGLTKIFTYTNPKDFIGMTSLKDQTELLVSIQKEKNLKNLFEARAGLRTVYHLSILIECNLICTGVL